MRIQKLTLVPFLYVILAMTGVVLASASSVWHGYSQSTRNSKILNRAFNDLNDHVGVQCKHWVQNVVYSASNQVVWLPLNKSNKYQWNTSSNVQPMLHPSPIEWVSPGQIIQMKWGSNPHTAIVVSKNSSGMTWIDSNWQWDQVVRTHFVTYSQFYAAVQGSYYTAYNIR